MEIKFLNLSYKEKNKYILKKINLKITSNRITGILGDKEKIIPRLLTTIMNYQGTIQIDKTNILGYNLQKISYIKKLDRYTFLTKLVSDEFYLRKKNLKMKETIYLEKIVASLNMVGLSKEYLKREINTLSKSEKRLLEISLNLITNPNIIIIDEPFLYLDNDSKYNFKKILYELKEKYQKTIIILSDDSNVLYELTDDLIIFKENQVLISGNTLSIFKDKDFLELNNIQLPNLILFNKIAFKYGIELDNYKDNKDLIKGVLDYVSKDNSETPKD